MEFDPIIATKYGKIKGFQFQAQRGYETEVFLGIPFAKPPVGELRFEKPQPPEPWEGILEAKTPKPPCITYPTMLNPEGQEDCLYLNLIRPKSPPPNANGYPVMFFIHGGGFLFGSANDANYEKAADRIVSKGVIFVAVQYRLGVLGFYTTGDSVAAGNYGIWDQIQGLKFVQEVVRDFGGDPDNVTLFGESAGGGSTSLITMAKGTENLFKRSIIMSGSTQAQWVFSEKVLESSNKINEVFGFSGSSEEKKKKLKTLNAEELINGTKQFVQGMSELDTLKIMYFNPTIDDDLINTEIQENYGRCCEKAKKKETLIGVCSQEALLFALASPLIVSEAKYVPLAIEKAEKFAEGDFIEAAKYLLSEDNAYGERFSEAIEKIIDFYLKQKQNYTHNEDLQTYVQLLSDIHFNIPCMREAIEKHKTGHQVYFYVYDFPPIENPLVDGAFHASDAIALFGGGATLPDTPLEGEYEKVVDEFAEVFVNFAKNGVPKCNELVVPKLLEDKIPFIRIGSTTKLEDNLWLERVKFWDALAEEFGYDWPSNRWIGEHL